MKELIGLKIEKILIEKGEERIVFVTDKYNVGYSTYGDCCSETWFADIIGVKNIIGNIVIDVKTIDVAPKADGRSRQEADEFMGIQIITDKGSADIIYRNSSNGYYGGNINSADLKCKEPEEFVSIEDEWSA